jgi:hypothetical protein
MNMKMTNRRYVLLLATVITPFISVLSLASTGNSEQQEKYQQPGFAHAQERVQSPITATIIEKQNASDISNNEPSPSLDVYLDWHKHWKLSHINRSDS